MFRVSVKQNENSGDLCNVRLIVDGTLPYMVADSNGHSKIVKRVNLVDCVFFMTIKK